MMKLVKIINLLLKSDHKIFPELNTESESILDIGCGRNKLPGSIGLDHYDLPGVDVVANLNEPFPFEDNQFSIVHANQVLEHVEDLIHVVYESHRILKPGGKLIAHVPYFRSSWAHIDPTHVRSFTLNTMNYFVKDTHEHDVYRFQDKSFSSIDIYLDSHKPSSTLRKLFTSLALRQTNRFENSIFSFIYPFEGISYVLTK